MPIKPTSIRDLTVGQYYEDCAYHPCICIGTDPDEGTIYGLSLVDGSGPRHCDVDHCGVRLLTVEEAITWKLFGPQQLPIDVVIPEGSKWWNKNRENARKYWRDPSVNKDSAT